MTSTRFIRAKSQIVINLYTRSIIANLICEKSQYISLALKLCKKFSLPTSIKINKKIER